MNSRLCYELLPQLPKCPSHRSMTLYTYARLPVGVPAWLALLLGLRITAALVRLPAVLFIWLRLLGTMHTTRFINQPSKYARGATLSASALPSVSAAVGDKPRTQFKTGQEFSPIINGCWQLAGGHGREVFDNIMEKLEAHAAAGLTTFDTADIYGPSEKILGDFNAARAAAGKPPVEIFTKYVPNIYQQKIEPAAVTAAIQRSCAALQVKQLDLVQLHWWEYGIPGMVDTALALADCQSQGLIKAVGTTNMGCDALQSILDAGVPVVANQVQFSLLDRRPLNGMLQLCEQHNIKLLTYGSLMGGLLSDKHVVEAPKPRFLGKPSYPNVDLNTSSLKMYYNIVRRAGDQELWRELLRVLRRIADGRGGDVTVANVALRWVMDQGNGNTVHPIVGLRGIDHISDNLRVLQMAPLTGEERGMIDEVLKKAQGPDGDIYSFERGM